MIIKANYHYETKPKNETTVMRQVDPHTNKIIGETEIKTPNESWKGSDYFEVRDNMSAAECSRKVIEHLKTEYQAVSGKVTKLTRIVTTPLD